LSRKLEGDEYFIKVGPYTCSVKYLDYDIFIGYYAGEHCDDDDDVDDCPYGMCNTVQDGYQILLRDDTKGAKRTVTFNHELIELINNQYDLCLSHQTISTLAEVLTQVELDNKEALKKLK
jgi:hypothetical protein